MAKSKWNRMVTIPVYRLSQAELEEAIHDWAEGSEDLEELLWLCYKSHVETSSCCANWYIDFRIDSSNREYLKRMLALAEDVEESQVHILPHAANFYCGPDWWREDIGINTPGYGEILFQALKGAFTEEDVPKGCYPRILDLYDFLKDKEADLSIRLKRNKRGQYRLAFEAKKSNPNIGFFVKLLHFTDLSRYCHGYERERYYECVCHADTYEEMNEKIDKILKVFQEKWDLVPPTEFTDNMTLLEKAVMMRKKFGGTPEGVQKLNQWINENKDPEDREVHYQF